MGGFFTKIFSKLSGKKQLKIIIIGLDNSGKTTILNKLHLNQVKQTVPSTYLFYHQLIQLSDLICKLSNIKILNFKYGISVDRILSGIFIVYYQILRYTHIFILNYIDNTGKCIILPLMLSFMLLIVKISKDFLKLHNNYLKF